MPETTAPHIPDRTCAKLRAAIQATGALWDHLRDLEQDLMEITHCQDNIDGIDALVEDITVGCDSADVDDEQARRILRDFIAELNEDDNTTGNEE